VVDVSCKADGWYEQGGLAVIWIFVIMQLGAKDSPDRRRADEIYEFHIAPTVREAGLEPYRSDWM
jgi:hypothetical protein